MLRGLILLQRKYICLSPQLSLCVFLHITQTEMQTQHEFLPPSSLMCSYVTADLLELFHSCCTNSGICSCLQWHSMNIQYPNLHHTGIKKENFEYFELLRVSIIKIVPDTTCNLRSWLCCHLLHHSALVTSSLLRLSQAAKVKISFAASCRLV